MATVSSILVPVDFTDASLRALDFGRMLADACGASLHLLHVMSYAAEDGERLNRGRQIACGRLEALLTDADRATRRVTTTCQVGTFAEEIVRCAVDNRVDLIVMGTHSRGPTFQIGPGIIAESVIEAAPFAVLVVKRRAPISGPGSIGG